MSAHWSGHLYADTPARRLRQLIGDLIGAVALLGCLWVGTGVHDLTASLAGPGRQLESAGAGLASRLDEAASAAADVPVVGEQLSAPFDEAGGAGRAIEDAGVQQQQAVGALADALGWLSGGVPAIVVCVLWLPRRLRFARHSAQAQRLLDAGVGLDIFALRALASQPIAELGQLNTDVAAGWRAGDPAVVRALAALELRALGLHPADR